MKKALFATTAAAALAAGGYASAQEITLFGDARLGLGYKVSNDGGYVDTDDDDLRAISRVRFGVRMTGETPTGITFGATIRADNAIAGEGNRSADGGSDVNPNNQTAGSVFVSGTYGTLTFGDINEAHQQHVGDLPELGLTGLTLPNEYPYLGNRVGGNDYRPTVRYDYDLAGLGLSLSTGTELDSIGLGVSYALDFAGGSFTLGAGYFDTDATTFTDPITDDDVDADGYQWGVGVNGSFGDINGMVQYIVTDLDGDTVGGVPVEAESEILGFGLGTAFGAFGVNALYRVELDDGFGGEDSAYGVDMTYDLGGGARLKGGVMKTLEVGTDTDPNEPGFEEFDNEWVADFGITMAF